jgi:hypothetical protein
VRESPFYFETHISHFESIGAGFFMAIIGSDKHSKRYFSRRFRSSPPGNWRLGPLVATARPVTAALLRKARGVALLPERSELNGHPPWTLVGSYCISESE